MHKHDDNLSILCRQRFFDYCVHNEKVKDCMSGTNEARVISLLETVGFKLGKDFERQYPIGCKFVLDFAFPKEQTAIEVDGESHRYKDQKALDKKRDRFLYANNWIIIRIKDKDLFGYKGSFYKFLMKYVVEERRRQYKGGRLHGFDFPEFVEADYEE